MTLGPFDLNLRHLRAAAAIRRCGSISRAAAQVALSQPALTQGIAKLESQLGLRLFDRGASGMSPTEAGTRLADRIDIAGAAMSSAFEAIRSASRSGFRGTENLVTMSQVRALLALAAAGSFVAAAQESKLTQPSLHRAVRDIERLSGVTLVERRGRGVRLTGAGQRLARGFSLALNEIESALDELHALAGIDTGRIRIGAMPLARSRLLPLSIARFHRLRPSAQIEVVEGPHGELIERLRDGRLDFLIGALRQPLPGPDVEQEALFDDRLAIVAGRDHPLAGAGRPPIERMIEYPWIIARPGTPLRQLWRRLFESRGLAAPPAPVTCGSVATIRVLLGEGEFLTLLSPNQIRDDLAAGSLVAISGAIEETRRPIGLTTRAGWRPPPAQAAFMALLRDMAVDSTLRGIE
ncbi:LysR family transcriptional regulator [Sphingosinicella terrae]|uniref:LysR family transcriptional regulator n=1 Tax=Sphingosinicella terrae TaxID=2172047 RepID=UPI000E0CF960|nr:LysR family transcriptional regulator [Sphingosinicella terrae]